MTPQSSSWRQALTAAAVSSSIVLGLGYLFIWMVGR